MVSDMALLPPTLMVGVRTCHCNGTAKLPEAGRRAGALPAGNLLVGRTAASSLDFEQEGTMATVDECRTALEQFAANLASNPKSVRKLTGFQRTLACDITDLDVSFHGRFDGGKLVDITDGDEPDAQIRMITSSDDLVKLVDGELDFMKAFQSGRVKIKANMMDLMKLRGVL
ncbi:hypothetical protein GCM10028833_27530 [Glycomyces tarimensis]